MYRPEFPYATPEGYEDQDFEYYFDRTNVIALGTTFASGTKVLSIPLPLQPDVDFYWRAVKIAITNSGTANGFMIRFRDGFGNYLSDLIPAYNYTPSPTPSQPPLGSSPVPLEPEVFCPAGTTVYIDIVAL